MEIILVFLFKICDNALATAKTVFVSKGKYLTGAMFNAFSFLFYTIAFSKALKDDSPGTTIAMCLAVFLGTYLTGSLIKKSERERLFIFDITSDTFENGIAFADELREHNLAIKTYITYDSNLIKTLSCKVYCTTKTESALVDSLIKKDFKYNKTIPVGE